MPDKEAVKRFLDNLPASEGEALCELSTQASERNWSGPTILACRAGIADYYQQVADTLRDQRFFGTGGAA
jgi:hypothetical protein